MRAYGVFAGGGIKGAALAGALAAAEDEKIEFVGYGGTSAGSIVAFLASLGFKGVDIGTLMKSTDFAALLDDGGVRLKAARESLSKASDHFSHGRHIRGAWKLKPVLSELWTTLGFYKGTKLQSFLIDQGKTALARLGMPDHEVKKLTDISFSTLEKYNCKPLKVVASDIVKRRAVVFPDDCHQYGKSVVAAVRASAAYPFVFAPIKSEDGTLLDGGLASNLPCFLFHREFENSRVRTLAFDLITERQTGAMGNLLTHAGAALGTALEASDIVLRSVSDGVLHVPISLPSDIGPFDLDLSDSKLRGLYDSGYAETKKILGEYEPLQWAKRPGLELQKRLWTVYGDPKLYQPVLMALVRDVEEFTSAKEVRANIMLSTDRGTRIVVYHARMDGDSDQDLELSERAGCTGRAWREGKATVASLEHAPGEERWEMSRQEHAKVRSDRKSMISVPIPDRSPWSKGVSAATTHPVGTLSVDSSTSLVDTNWVGSLNDANSPIVKILQGWAYVITRLLP